MFQEKIKKTNKFWRILMVLDETLNNPKSGFEVTSLPQAAMSQQLTLMPFWNDDSSVGQREGLPFFVFGDEDSEDDDDMSEDENFDDMDDDLDDDFEDDEDDFDNEDDDYEDEDEDFDYEEDVDYDDFDE
jgi:hypothetical protein